MSTTHLKTQKVFVINGLTESSADDIKFPRNDGQKISVTDYFKNLYQPLRYPRLPCVIERHPGRREEKINESCYPLEVLKIVDGQRVPREKQEDLVGFCFS